MILFARTRPRASAAGHSGSISAWIAEGIVSRNLERAYALNVN